MKMGGKLLKSLYCIVAVLKQLYSFVFINATIWSHLNCIVFLVVSDLTMRTNDKRHPVENHMNWSTTLHTGCHPSSARSGFVQLHLSRNRSTSLLEGAFNYFISSAVLNLVFHCSLLSLFSSIVIHFVIAYR